VRISRADCKLANNEVSIATLKYRSARAAVRSLPFINQFSFKRNGSDAKNLKKLRSILYAGESRFARSTR